MRVRREDSERNRAAPTTLGFEEQQGHVNLVRAVARANLKTKLPTAAQRACVFQKERTYTTGVSNYVNTNTKSKHPSPVAGSAVLMPSEPRRGPCCRLGVQGWPRGLPTHRGLVQGAGAFRAWGAGVSLLQRRRGKGETHGSPVLWDWRWTDGHETRRGSRLGAARAHRPERRQLPRSVRSHRGWWGSLGHAGAGVRAEKPKTSPGHSCFAKSSQVVTTGGKSREDMRPARPVANGHAATWERCHLHR